MHGPPLRDSRRFGRPQVHSQEGNAFMGPTNVALVKLFEADRKLRDAQERFESAAHNVRIQERRVSDLAEKLRLAQQTHKEQQATAGRLDLELKSRDQHIEKLRNQQQAAKNNKEYQALLIEINTRKVDRAKIEEQALANLDAVEKQKAEAATFATALEGEKTKLAAMKEQIGDTLSKLQAEVDATKPEREAAEADVPAAARDIFNRLADRYDGEAMAGIDRPDRRKEEYLCTACNMELVRDIYNKLNSRNEVVFCPNCQRILFIPDHFTAEHAMGGPSRGGPKRASKPTIKTGRPSKKKAPAPSGDAAAAGAAPAEAEEDVVLIEPRARGELGRALSKAQGESVSRANKSDTTPVEAEVHVDGKLAGIYKGISIENLERAIKYFMGELKLTYTTLEVKPVTDAPETPASDAPAAPTQPAPASEPPASMQPVGGEAAAQENPESSADDANASGTEAQPSGT
jgi:predicted  nucleic acid-binding Zn-ribbon protein